MPIVLETLSDRLLYCFLSFLVLVEVACFLLGGLISPNPNTVQTISGSICLDTRPRQSRSSDDWHTVLDGTSPSCKRLKSFEDVKATADDIVFVFEFPLPRNGGRLKMSRWFQWMIGLLSLEIEYDDQNQFHEGAILRMNARLGGRMAGESSWTSLGSTIASSDSLSSKRPIHCNLDRTIKDWPYDCDLVPLFELGSIYYEHYVVNVKMPESKNWDLGHLVGMTLNIIHPTGGFTTVFWSLKTFFFVVVLTILCWTVRRIFVTKAGRISLLQRMLVALGVATSILNLPVDWLSLWFSTPFMIFYSDIRQGAFYTFLMLFWLVFAGEHMMDASDIRRRGSLKGYWRELTIVSVASVCLFAFDLAIRGVHLADPFFNVWSSPGLSNLTMFCVVLAGIAAVAYFATLAFYIFRVLRNILAKRHALRDMALTASAPAARLRNRRYARLTYRFTFVMGLTLAAAALSISFYIVGQIAESEWKWPSFNSPSEDSDAAPSANQEPRLQYTAAFLTGVYGMWNIYVAALLVLYAPAAAGVSMVLSRSLGALNQATDSQAPIVEQEDDSDADEDELLNQGRTLVEENGGGITHESYPLTEMTEFLAKPTDKLT